MKTVSFYMVFWFTTVCIFGCIGELLMCYVRMGDDATQAGVKISIFGLVLFGAIAAAGLVGIILLVTKHLILKRVYLYGTETTATYEGTAGIREEGGGRNSYPYRYTAIVFSYVVAGRLRKYKTCAVYSFYQAENLERAKTFRIRYKGKHAVITEAC